MQAQDAGDDQYICQVQTTTMDAVDLGTGLCQPYVEGFWGGVLPDEWVIDDSNWNSGWNVWTVQDVGGNQWIDVASHCASAPNQETPKAQIVGEELHLITPFIFVAAYASLDIGFDLMIADFGFGIDAQLDVDIRSLATDPWTNVASYNSNQSWNPEVIVDVETLATIEDYIQIRFTYVNNSTGAPCTEIGIDHVYVGGQWPYTWSLDSAPTGASTDILDYIQSSDLGNPNALVSGLNINGEYSFMWSLCQSFDESFVVITKSDPNYFYLQYDWVADICDNDLEINVPIYESSNQVDGTWVITSNAPSGVTDNMDGSWSYNPSMLGPGLWNVEILFTPDDDMCDILTSYQINVIESKDYSIQALSSYEFATCDDAVELIGIGGPGYFVGNGITTIGTDSYFDPALAGVGCHEIYYTGNPATGSQVYHFNDPEILQDNVLYSWQIDVIPDEDYLFRLFDDYGDGLDSDSYVKLIDCNNNEIAIWDNLDYEHQTDFLYNLSGCTTVTIEIQAGSFYSEDIRWEFSGYEATTETIDCSNPEVYYFTVTEPIVILPSNDVFSACANSLPVDIVGVGFFPKGGTVTYTGDGVINNQFYPSFFSDYSTLKYVDVIYEYNGCTVAIPDAISFQINDDPEDFTYPETVCIGAGIQNLLSDQIAPHGIFSGPGVTNTTEGAATFDPLVAGVGVHNVSYSIYETFSENRVWTDEDAQIFICTGTEHSWIYDLPASLEFEIFFELPNGTLEPNEYIELYECGVKIAEFTAGDFVNGSFVLFNLANCTNGSGELEVRVSLEELNVGTLTFELSGNTQTTCEYVTTHQISVLEPEVFTVALPKVCISDDLILYGQQIIPAGAAVSYAGPGVSGGVFDASIAGIGTHTITVNYNYSGACDISSTFDVEVIPDPYVIWDTENTTYSFCNDQGPVTISTNQMDGELTGTGISDNGDGTAIFNPSGLSGTQTISYQSMAASQSMNYTEEGLIQDGQSSYSWQIEIPTSSSVDFDFLDFYGDGLLGNSYIRIYDCGNIIYEINNSNGEFLQESFNFVTGSGCGSINQIEIEMLTDNYPQDNVWSLSYDQPEGCDISEDLFIDVLESPMGCWDACDRMLPILCGQNLYGSLDGIFAKFDHYDESDALAPVQIYQFVAPYTGTYTLDLNSFSGSDLLSLYVSEGNPCDQTLIESWLSQNTFIETFTAVADQNYYIAVLGVNGTQDFSLAISHPSCSIFDPCADGYTGTNRLQGSLGLGYIYDTNKSIESEQIIGENNSDIVVEFSGGTDATEYIELLPGFEVIIGVEFHAHLNDCLFDLNEQEEEEKD